MIENKAVALERLSSWKLKGALLLFAFSKPDSKFSISVEVKSVDDEQLTFGWILNASDAQGAFVITNGYFQVHLKHASLFVSDDSGPSVTISHGDFRCVLTVILATGFAH
jgi:hypothetical protein